MSIPREGKGRFGSERTRKASSPPCSHVALCQPFIYFFDVYVAGLCAVAGADVAAGFHEVEQACGAGVADFQATLEERCGCFLCFGDHGERFVEEVVTIVIVTFII